MRNLWVDDMRNPHDYAKNLPFEDWTWVEDVASAITVLKTGSIRVLFLDHDLGELETAQEIVDWMAQHCVWPNFVYVHSANPIGVANMLRTIDNYGPYTERTSDGRGRFTIDFKV